MSNSPLEQVVSHIQSGPDLASLPPNELRTAYDKHVSDVTVADPQTKFETIVLNGVPGETSLAPNSSTASAILYFHGGGYVAGSIVSHRGLVARLGAAAKAITYAMDYRLAPEHPYPAASDDAINAYRGLLDLGIAPDKIAICGDSAGGGLALATTIRARDEGLALPGAIVLFSPMTDLSVSGESIELKKDSDILVTPEVAKGMAGIYLGASDAKTPYASPLFADLRGLPPTLIHVSTAEILQDDSTRLARNLCLADVPTVMRSWKSLPHVWQLYAGILPEGVESLDQAGAFLQGYIA